MVRAAAFGAGVRKQRRLSWRVPGFQRRPRDGAAIFQPADAAAGLARKCRRQYAVLNGGGAASIGRVHRTR